MLEKTLAKMLFGILEVSLICGNSLKPNSVRMHTRCCIVEILIIFVSIVSINIYENKGLGPTAQYLSVMINIPKLSTLAIQSIWNMVASPSMRKSIAALLEEVQFVDNASAETQSVNKAHTSTISYEGQANKLGSTNDKLEKLRDCIEGKTVVLTGVLFALDGKNRNEAIPRAAVASAILSLGSCFIQLMMIWTLILIF